MLAVCIGAAGGGGAGAITGAEGGGGAITGGGGALGVETWAARGVTGAGLAAGC